MCFHSYQAAASQPQPIHIAESYTLAGGRGRGRRGRSTAALVQVPDFICRAITLNAVSCSSKSQAHLRTASGTVESVLSCNFGHFKPWNQQFKKFCRYVKGDQKRRMNIPSRRTNVDTGGASGQYAAGAFLFYFRKHWGLGFEFFLQLSLLHQTWQGIDFFLCVLLLTLLSFLEVFLFWFLV